MRRVSLGSPIIARLDDGHAKAGRVVTAAREPVIEQGPASPLNPSASLGSAVLFLTTSWLARILGRGHRRARRVFAMVQLVRWADPRSRFLQQLRRRVSAPVGGQPPPRQRPRRRPAIFNRGRSKPSPSMSTQTIIRTFPSFNASITRAFSVGFILLCTKAEG